MTKQTYIDFLRSIYMESAKAERVKIKIEKKPRPIKIVVKPIKIEVNK